MNKLLKFMLSYDVTTLVAKHISNIKYKEFCKNNNKKKHKTKKKNKTKMSVFSHKTQTKISCVQQSERRNNK